MQVRMFTANKINAAGGAPRIKNQPVQASGGAFGSAQCRVTISREGRKLSEQAKTQKSAQSLKAEKMMLRLQEQPDLAEEAKNEYLDLLKEITDTVKSINSSCRAGGDEITAEKKAQLIQQMREQKQKQIAENQKKAKEAQQMAMQTSMIQDEIDQNNRDLIVLLKSIEESEKDNEENRDKGGKTEGGNSNGAEAENSVGDIIQNAATQFTVSSAKREMDVVGMINALNEEGHAYLDMADETVRNAVQEAESIKELLKDEGCTDAEKEETVSRYYEKITGAYKELADYRRRGLQMIQDAKECRLKHIADNPLQGMEETKKSMMDSAVDAAINEASQGRLDAASQELQDVVDELIDERNDIDHVESDEKEKDEEQQLETIGENLKPAETEEE